MVECSFNPKPVDPEEQQKVLRKCASNLAMLKKLCEMGLIELDQVPELINKEMKASAKEFDPEIHEMIYGKESEEQS